MPDRSIWVRYPSRHGAVLRGGLSRYPDPASLDPPSRLPQEAALWAARFRLGFRFRRSLCRPPSTQRLSAGQRSPHPKRHLHLASRPHHTLRHAY